MLSLLLGPDDFSKSVFLQELTAKNPVEVLWFGEENLPMAENLASQDLFSQPKIFVLKGLLDKFNQPEIVAKFLSSKNQIFILEEKLDKRLSVNKNLLADKNIKVKEFALPHGNELDAWVFNRVKALKGSISPDAASELALRLGRDKAKETKVGGKLIAVEEVYNLWQADSEIKKLLAFAETREIGAQDVKGLVMESGEVDVFDLTNAIGDGQKQKALGLLSQFLKNQSASDEKGAIIQLNALLSEQFRNVAMVQDFLARHKSEAEILELTGWKSGRLFVMKKIASRFSPKIVLEFLTKLTALDEELKTSQTPPRVLLDLIVGQLLI